MRIFKRGPICNGDEQPFHIIKKPEWRKDDESENKLLIMHLNTMCGLKFRIRDGKYNKDKLTTYEHKKHLNGTCEKCKRIVKEYVKKKKDETI